MKFIRKHWYDLGLIPIICTITYLVLKWSDISILQRLSLFNFIAIFVHQFEEYRFPGGEPAITNMALQRKNGTKEDRYPLNQNNAMLINCAAGYIFYFLPIFFPNVIWLGFAPVLFGMGQLIVHGIMTPKKIGNKIYSPGLFAVFFGHVLVGLYWFYYTISNGLLNITNVLLGILYMALFIGGFMMKVGYGIFKSENSKYPFDKNEFERGGYAEKIRKINSHK